MNSPETASAMLRTSDAPDSVCAELTGIWERLLNVTPIGPDQNYFDLGGDSSLAVHLFSEIERVFKVKLPLATLFEAQSVGSLSAVIRSQTQAEAPQSTPLAPAPVGNATSQSLTEIWQRLLGANSIAPDQNYFDLGGDSSLAVHLFAEIEKKFSVKLPLATLFEAPTIAEMSEVIRRQAPAAELSEAAKQLPDGTIRLLSEIWQRLLGVPRIEPDQNYFDLGGDSSLAVHLFAEVEKAFGVKLPLATLFEAPTLSELAQAIRTQTPAATPAAAAEPFSGWSPLVGIQTSGSRPPLFCVHGAGGVVLIYRDLAMHLGADQPFYGLQAVGLDGSSPPLTRVEDMAALYIKEIRRIQPHGPYFLGGYCAGGTIAYEVAQQLSAQGEQIGLLALFDTLNWSMFPHLSIWAKAYQNWQRLWFHVANVFALDSAGRSKFLSEKARQLRNRIPVWKGILQSKITKGPSDHASKSRLLAEIWQVNDRAVVRYIPKPYGGKLLDFRPKKQYRVFDKPGARWDDLAQGGQEVINLPVYPAGMLIDPFVKSLAAALKNLMDAAIQRCNSGQGSENASMAPH